MRGFTKEAERPNSNPDPDPNPDPNPNPNPNPNPDPDPNRNPNQVKVAEKFTNALAAKLGKLPPEAEQKALCVLPAWAAKFRGATAGPPPVPKGLAPPAVPLGVPPIPKAPPALPGGGAAAAAPKEPVNALFAAIEARKAVQEARMAAIASGELTVEDPREKRLREQAAQEKAEKAAAKAAKKAAKDAAKAAAAK